MNECSEIFTIINELGLHARAATKLVQTTNTFDSEVSIEKDGQSVNGKSIMGVLMLVASIGTQIHVTATGPDAELCLKAIGDLINDRFGEEK